MAETITHEMIFASSDKCCRWAGQPDRLAEELYSNCPESESPGVLNDADLFAVLMYGELDRIKEGKVDLSEGLESDQLEDWLVARAVRRMLESREATRQLRG
jgi:hypothetical protein